MSKTTLSEPGSAAEHQPLGMTGASLSLLTAALWGGTPVAIQFTAETLPPVMVSGLRFGLATFFMYFWCHYERAGLTVRANQYRPILIAGLLLFAQISLFTSGVAESSSSHGSLLINTFLFWVAGIEHFITRTERLTIRKLAGLILAGTAALFAVGWDSAASVSHALLDVPTLFGDALLVLSGLVLAIKILYTKRVVRLVEPGKLLFWQDLFGTFLFVAFSLVFETTPRNALTRPVILGLLYQGVIVAGFCFALQAYQLKRHSASQISIFSAATPLFGIAMGVLFRGDVASPWLLAAGVVVAWGIWLVTVTPAPARRSRMLA